MSDRPNPETPEVKTKINNSQNGQTPIPRQTQEVRYWADSPLNRIKSTARNIDIQDSNSSIVGIILTALTVMAIGLILNNIWVGVSGSLVAFLICLRVILPSLKGWVLNFLTPQEQRALIATVGMILAIAGFLNFIGFYHAIDVWLISIKWDEFGSWADWVGALGQIMIAVLAVYVAWQQYVISKDLTIRQNMITQQQTIDTYFQGISDLALNEEGLLEDWPQERAFAEGRTAAILSSVDAAGKAKIIRFLSQARLLSPLKRDNLLGRPMLDGYGGYEEDRISGVRVIDLGVMLAGADLGGTDLRWTDFSEANLVRANLSCCDLVKANLARTILYEVNLAGADLKASRLFYGNLETASPASRIHPPNYETGAYTGAVVENANFNKVQRLSEEQRIYVCRWGGEKTRNTIPGGCEGIPNKLGR